MPEMRGADLVVEYLIREKVPYLFGYAGHGAVGLLDGSDIVCLDFETGGERWR